MVVVSWGGGIFGFGVSLVWELGMLFWDVGGFVMWGVNVWLGWLMKFVCSGGDWLDCLMVVICCGG